MKLVMASCPIVLAVLLQIQSQPPIPSPPKPAQEHQNQSGPENKKTHTNQTPAESSAMSPNKEVSVIAGGNQHDRTAYGENQSTNEWWLVGIGAAGTIVNGVIAFLIFLQWRNMQIQIRLVQRNLVVTRTAVAAAVKSAAAAVKSADSASVSAKSADKTANEMNVAMTTALDRMRELVDAEQDANRLRGIIAGNTNPS